MAEKEERHKNWFFTQFNVENDAFKDHKDVLYACWQLEECPSTKRRHLQGNIWLKHGKTRSAVKKKVFKDKGIACWPTISEEGAETYCMKENTRIAGPWTIGTKQQQGKRNDLVKVAETIKERGLNTAIREHPAKYIQYHRGMEKLGDFYEREKYPPEENFRKLYVEVLYGTAGCGKTKKAMSDPDNTYKLDMGHNVWFDGYNGQPILVIDDFYGWIPYGQLLNILDGYKLKVEKKGGHVYANWRTVYITSNKHPCEWYKQGMTEALARRINKITKLGNCSEDKCSEVGQVILAGPQNEQKVSTNESEIEKRVWETVKWIEENPLDWMP